MGTLSEDENVVRYIRPGLHDTFPSADAFRDRDNQPSVNWLGCFGLPVENQLTEVKKRIHMDLNPNGWFLKFKVGHAKEVARRLNVCLAFLKKPNCKTERFPEDDPSHCVVVSCPALLAAEVLAEMTDTEIHLIRQLVSSNPIS